MEKTGKRSKKSKSLEEISNIPPQSKPNLTRGHAARHSLQTVSSSQDNSPLRHTKSQNYGKPKRLTSARPETERIEEEDDESVKIEMESDARSSQASKKSHRSRSGSSSQTRKESGALDNKGYDGTLDSISVISTRSLDRDVRNSGRSSTRASSISLEVQREQYCCQARWTACEKRLCGMVVILVTIIIMLLIAVAVLA